jgi:4-hydroxythreonine-4-phosphate dehydrogenase
MDTHKIKVGITQGDINGVGMEVILKTFENATMFDLCTPVLYGSVKAVAYHRKTLNLPTNFTPVRSAADAVHNRLYVVNTREEEIKIELGTPSAEAGTAAREALELAIEEYKKGLIDVLVTAPIHKQTISGEEFPYHGHTEYLEARTGEGAKSLMILLKGGLRVALATTHIPISAVPTALTKDLIKEKIRILNHSLQKDFGIGRPRIAVLALNPHAGDGGLIGTEEQDFIIPALAEVKADKILAFGPFPADGFFGSDHFMDFDAILAMYHDQGLAPFKALVMDEAINFTAGLPLVRTSPAHGTAYDIAGKGTASPASFRQAVFTAIDLFRTRRGDEQARINPLQKSFFDRRDDSDRFNFNG